MFHTAHYVVKFRGTPFISTKISFQALKFEFNLPIPNGFGHTLVERYSSSIVSIVHTERKCKIIECKFLPARKEIFKTRNNWRSFSCPLFEISHRTHWLILFPFDFWQIFEFVKPCFAEKMFRFFIFFYVICRCYKMSALWFLKHKHIIWFFEQILRKRTKDF